MSNPNVRKVGQVDDFDGARLEVGVDHDLVTFGYGTNCWRLPSHQVERFAQLFIAACWQAAAYHEDQP